MTHIAILSDTHGLLREQVKAELAAADCIIHAGDLNTPAIVEVMREYGTAYIVRGNNEKKWAEDFPKVLPLPLTAFAFSLSTTKRTCPKT